VVGTTGSGKTTLARALAAAYGIPHTPLDDLYHQPGWQRTPSAEFIAAVDRATTGPAWAVDGNYREVRELIWTRATHVIWIDLPLLLTLRQMLQRVWLDWRWKRPTCNGNQQSWRAVFIGHEGLFWWLLTTYHRRKRQYESMFADPQWEGRERIRLRSRREIAALAKRHGATLTTD